MGTPASLLDLIAHGGSLRASQDNAAQLAQTQHTQAQIPLIEQQALQAQQEVQTKKLQNQITQQQLQDQEIQRQIFAEAGRNSRSAVDETGSPLPSVVRGGAGAPAPRIATPPFNPNAPAANAPVVPNYLSDPRSLAAEMARRGASAQGVLGAFQGITTLNTNINKLSKEQLDLEKEQHGLVADSLQGYLSTPDAQKPQAYAQFYQDAVTREPNLKSELPAPGGAPSQDDLAHVIGKVHLFGTLLDQAEKKSKTAETDALASKTKLETAVKQYTFDLMRNPDPVAASASVDAIIDPVKYPDQNKMAKALSAAELKATGDPAKAAEAVRKVADGILDVQKKDLEIPIKVKEQAAMIPGEVQKQKALLPGEVQKAVSVENATSGLKVAQAVATAKALRAGDNAAVQGVAPGEIGKVQDAALKMDKEYSTAKAAADEMQTLIDLAKSGNKLAYAYAPTTGVLTINSGNGVKRVNMAEINQYAGAGSDFDRVQQFFGKHLTGESIDSSILKAMEQTHTALGQNAYKKYSGDLDSLNKRTGAKFQPTFDPPGGKTSSKVGETVMVGNKKVKISAIHADGTFDGDEVK